jgi:hypothetical protein
MSAPTITFWRNLLDPEGTERVLEWEALFARFERVEPFRGQDEHPGWSPAKFSPCRRGLENVKSVFAVCLDYDGGEPIDAARAAWLGYRGFLHTTRKHTSDAHRFRVILPLVRPVSPYEFAALWRRVNAHAGGRLDPSPKDPSRFWFVPGAGDHEGAEYRSERWEGALLDPDEWLCKPEPAQPQAQRSVHEDATALERRAIAYIGKMPAALSGSGGHKATWQVALVLAKGFNLNEQATLRILLDHYNPRCEPAWSEKELTHKAKQAQKARTPDGFKLDDEREWTSQSRGWSDDVPHDDEPPPDFVEDEPPMREPGDDTNEKTNGAAATVSAVERYGFLSMLDLMQQVAEELNKPRPRTGARTGSIDLDDAIGGFRHGNVTVFGAKRGFGKTSYGNLVTSLAMPDINVLMFAGEDAATMYGKRFLAARANLNAMLLRDYRCNRDDWPRITQALTDAPRNPFFVRCAGKPIEWVAKAIRDVSKEQRVDLVIVDYLQKFRTAKKLQDRRNEVTYVTATLQDAIKTAGAAGLLFSQLKRTERLEPDVEDLKESGDIEDMADHILLGWKVDANGSQKHAQRFIKLAKNKDGTEASEVQPVPMPWNVRTANFEEQKAPFSEFEDGFQDGMRDFDDEARYP